MAAEIWLTPDELREYSNNKDVKKRTDLQLQMDIYRAKSYIVCYTHNSFDDAELLPEEVKIALLLIAEQYAIMSFNPNDGLKSETYDDYAYTRADKAGIDIEALGLDSLLDDWVIEPPKTGVTLKMQAI
ncbi:MAG: DUF3199 family protein [Oscillospiraceae bacterium]|jgi:hypothetical protein|nr:DUF3199 family protein [Oscillospiraceae bacterium]